MHAKTNAVRFVYRLCFAIIASLMGIFGGMLQAVAKPTKEAIVKYIQRCKVNAIKADFIKTFGRDYSGLDLRGVDFKAVHRVGFESNLKGANFSKSNLTKAQFGGANLERANFRGAILDKAQFVTANLKYTDFRESSLKGTTFQESYAHHSTFTKVDLSKTDVSGVDWDGANLRYAIFTGVKNSLALSFPGADLSHAKLKGLDLEYANLRKANLSHADLTGSRLSYADLTGATLRGTSLQGITIRYAKMDDLQGISVAQASALKDKAQRWKYDLQEGAKRFLKAAFAPVYLFVLALLTWLGIRLWKGRVGGRIIKITIGINILLLPTFGILCLMYLGQFSPVAQISAGNPFAMLLWTSWLFLWPFYYFGSILLSAVSLGLAGWYLFAMAKGRVEEQMRRECISLLLLTIIHCLCAFKHTITHFPTA